MPRSAKKKWDFQPVAKVGDVLRRGDLLGTVPEERFHHSIMVPFSCFGAVTLESVAKAGSFTLETVVATGRDENGQLHEFSLLQRWPIKMSLQEGRKVRPSEMMDTGLRIIDTQFPVLKGGTFCSPGPFGAGKTVMQHHLSKYLRRSTSWWIVACGERAGEVVEVLRTFPQIIDHHTHESLMKRTVMICSTPPPCRLQPARPRSTWERPSPNTIGRWGSMFCCWPHSTSRWGAGDARDVGSPRGDSGGGGLSRLSRLAHLRLLRAGRRVAAERGAKTGSLTIGGSVSPAGGNFEEPVTQASLAIVGAFHGLSRIRSDARRYPAVDPLISWTKYLGRRGAGARAKISRAGRGKILFAEELLRKSDEIGKRMEVVGEEGVVMEDMLTYLKGELYEFCYLQQNAFDKEDAYCPLERQIEMFGLIHRVFENRFEFDTHESARTFFLALQKRDSRTSIFSPSNRPATKKR